MGNCFSSKSANQDDQFSTPGRTLGSSSQSQPSSAPVPQKIISNTPGRTVGVPGAATGGDDPRIAAARAAKVCLIEALLIWASIYHTGASRTSFSLPTCPPTRSLTHETGASSQSITVNREALKPAASTETADTEPGAELSV